jgi:hypothetical protein
MPNNKGSWPCWPAMYFSLDDSSISIIRLLNNEAEIAKGTIHVNWGMTLSVHVIATASAEKQKHTKVSMLRKKI